MKYIEMTTKSPTLADMRYHVADMEIRIEETVETENYCRTRLQLQTTTCDPVDLYWVRPLSEGPWPLVVFLHWLEPEAKDSNATQFLPMAEELASRGIASILPDCFWSVDADKYQLDSQFYRNQWWKTEVEADTGLIRSQLQQLQLCLAYTRGQAVQDPSQWVLAGHDFGAMFGILLSVLSQSFQALILMAATGKFSDWFRFGSQLNEQELERYREALTPLDPLTHIGAIRQPVHLFFAEDDVYVPAETAEELFAAASEPKEVRYYQAQHGMNRTAFDDMKQLLLSYLTAS